MIRALLLLLMTAWPAAAATINALSASRTDVGDAVNSSATGDTVFVPAGIATWTNILTIPSSKAITFRGAGKGLTIIRDGVADRTAFFSVAQPLSNTFTRVTGFTFTNDPSANSVNNFNGCITISGCNTNGGDVRIDNCGFEDLCGVSVFNYGAIPLVDHCTGTNSQARIILYCYHQNWDGYDNSDGSWAVGPMWGTKNFMFAEDCVFGYPDGINYAVDDAYRGARIVLRYNRFIHAWVEAHGTDSGGRLRGTRAMEVYWNLFIGDGSLTRYVINCRSGSFLAHDNVVTNYGFTPVMELDAYRRFYKFSYFGQCDGTNQWDINDAGNPYAFGTATAGSGSQTLVDSGKSWTVNQWVGYQVTRTNNPGVYDSSTITANTATTLTTDGSGGYGAAISFASGDKYIITKITHAFDQPGRAYGTRLSGDTPAPPVVPYDQQTDPIYAWNNTNGVTGGGVAIYNNASFIRTNEHYFGTQYNYTNYPYPHPLIAITEGTASTNRYILKLLGLRMGL